MEFDEIVASIGEVVDAFGIAVIIGGILLSSIQFIQHKLSNTENAYQRYRQGIGRAILLGLEILVAADIIRTVGIKPDFESVGVLAMIVLIRTFLSWTLEVELSGRFPWQRRENEESEV